MFDRELPEECDNRQKFWIRAWPNACKGIALCLCVVFGAAGTCSVSNTLVRAHQNIEVTQTIMDGAVSVTRILAELVKEVL